MTVPGETADYYRYIDLTGVTEGLFELMEETLAVDLFIRLVVQNQGTLSGRKRDRHSKC